MSLSYHHSSHLDHPHFNPFEWNQSWRFWSALFSYLSFIFSALCFLSILFLFCLSWARASISQQQQPASLLSLCQSIPSSFKCCLWERQIAANKLHKTTSVKSKTRMMVVITYVSSDALDSYGHVRTRVGGHSREDGAFQHPKIPLGLSKTILSDVLPIDCCCSLDKFIYQNLSAIDHNGTGWDTIIYFVGKSCINPGWRLHGSLSGQIQLWH